MLSDGAQTDYDLLIPAHTDITHGMFLSGKCPPDDHATTASYYQDDYYQDGYHQDDYYQDG